jgi:sterol desaturase/sphingolipid hydroxylase (fatty acid hydroxylase superfamily)
MPVLVVLGFLAIAFAERRRPLRKRVEPQRPHVARDLAIGGISAVVTSLLQRRYVQPLAERIEREQLGILNAVRMPRPLRIAAGVLLLDYTLWIWHRLNHEVPALWRFHRAHHIDRDLDAATGVRFHAGEMALSVLQRMAQLRLIGPDDEAVALWQTALLISIALHHSNLKLPADFERALSRVLVTPRMHGIHHSDRREDADSNFASLFTFWDSLHGTFRWDLRDDAITIGVPKWESEEATTFGRVMESPIENTTDDWERPEMEEVRDSRFE